MTFEAIRRPSTTSIVAMVVVLLLVFFSTLVVLDSRFVNTQYVSFIADDHYTGIVLSFNGGYCLVQRSYPPMKPDFRFSSLPTDGFYFRSGNAGFAYTPYDLVRFNPFWLVLPALAFLIWSLRRPAPLGRLRPTTGFAVELNDPS